MTSTRYLASLAHELSERAARACVSYVNPRNDALRAYLHAALAAAPGDPGSLLAKPVAEAMFEWRSAGKSLTELGLLHADTVRALGATSELDGQVIEALFPEGRLPYQHQLEAWTHLAKPEVRGVLVRTGTASGKTESFLVPILDSLARELAEKQRAPMVGVRALFLYPLNALINSQRDRLLAATLPFGDKLRFSLYNGNTPEKLPAREQLRGPEVCDRATLREAPPPLLITNATMLEYMLVRQRDEAILEASRGRLRYIVIDEAHSYLGSSAAELALLLRRVMHGFDVRPEQVQFIATSATIGDADIKTEAKLRDFLAQLAGVATECVHVVGGAREAPPLSADMRAEDLPLPSARELESLDAEALGRRLVSVQAVRVMRDKLSERAHVVDTLGFPPEEALALLDAASRATLHGKPFLPLRGHFYMRTFEGIWCCINSRCRGRSGNALASDRWPWGKVFLSARKRCDACDGIVAEQVTCRRCGEAYLVVEDKQGALAPVEWEVGRDFDDEDEDVGDPLSDDDVERDRTGAERLLLADIDGARAADGHVHAPVPFDPHSGAHGPGIQTESAIRFATPEAGASLRCGHCGAYHGDTRRTLRRARLGVNYLLRNALWVVGEHMPPETRRGANDLPATGRRLITFTDSRQGTARHALLAELEAEKTWLRAKVYHEVWKARRNFREPSHITAARSNLLQLEALGNVSALASVIASLKKEIAAFDAAPPPGVTWRELRRAIRQSGTHRVVLESMKRNYLPTDLDEEQIADGERQERCRVNSMRPRHLGEAAA